VQAAGVCAGADVKLGVFIAYLADLEQEENFSQPFKQGKLAQHTVPAPVALWASSECGLSVKTEAHLMFTCVPEFCIAVMLCQWFLQLRMRHKLHNKADRNTHNHPVTKLIQIQSKII
jgi:hypothetical protein